MSLRDKLQLQRLIRQVTAAGKSTPGGATAFAGLDVTAFASAATVSALSTRLDADEATLAGLPGTVNAGTLQGHPASDFATPASVAAKPDLSSATPQPVGTAAAGAGTSAARADHVHAHGNQGGGSLHADATTSTAGFLNAADKAKLDSVASGAAALGSFTPYTVQPGSSPGSNAQAAHADHAHGFDDTSHGSRGGGALHSAAVAGGANGFLTGTDKAKLDSLVAGGVQPGQYGTLPNPATGMPYCSNFNTASAGWGYWDPSSLNGPNPGAYGIVYTWSQWGTNVTPASGVWIYQTVYNTSGSAWMRWNINGSGWTYWTTLISTDASGNVTVPHYLFAQATLAPNVDTQAADTLYIAAWNAAKLVLGRGAIWTECPGGLKTPIVDTVNAGDTLGIGNYANAGTVLLGRNGTPVKIYAKTSGGMSPLDIAAGAWNRVGAGFSFANGTTAVVPYDNKSWDSHNAATLGASFSYKVPITGIYLIHASVCFQSFPVGNTASAQLVFFRNGGSYARLSELANIPSTGSGAYRTITGSAVLAVNLNDTIDFRLVNQAGASLTLWNDAGLTWCSITRIPGSW